MTTSVSSGFTFGLPTTASAFSFGSLSSGTSTVASNTGFSLSSGPGTFSFNLQTSKPAVTSSSQLGFGFSPFSTASKVTTSTTNAFALNPATNLGNTTSVSTTSNITNFGVPAMTSSSILFGASTSQPSATTLPQSSAFSLTSQQAPLSTSLTPFSFGSLGVTITSVGAQPPTTGSQSTVSSTLGTTTTPTTISSSPFSFGVSSVAPLSTKPSGPVSTSSIVFGTTPADLSSSSIVVSTTTVSSAAPIVSATSSAATTANVPQTLSYNQLEELINKWTHELEEQERYFTDEAKRINQWDQALVKNAENITAIYEKVETCQKEQTRLEQELDFIEGQQRELETLLEPLERAANELPPGQLHSDYEREAIFQLATNVDLELGQLLTDLRDMAEQTNSANLCLTSSSTLSSGSVDVGEIGTPTKRLPSNGPDTMHQITRILNCHMHSLNWIHHNTQEIMDRLKMLNAN